MSYFVNSGKIADYFDIITAERIWKNFQKISSALEWKMAFQN